MESSNDLIERLWAGELSDAETEDFVAELKKTCLVKYIKDPEISTKADTLIEPESKKLGIEDLKLKNTKFYRDKIGMSPADLLKIRKAYNKLGHFDYSDATNKDDIQEWIGMKYFINVIYIGQLKPGTDQRHGIGICVKEPGATI